MPALVGASHGKNHHRNKTTYDFTGDPHFRFSHNPRFIPAALPPLSLSFTTVAVPPRGMLQNFPNILRHRAISAEKPTGYLTRLPGF
jgi:hypothetical protein